MGAVSFSLDKCLVDILQSALSLNVFVETGTFQGDSLASLQDNFKLLHSIELSTQLYQAAAVRFADVDRIRLHQGDSAFVLRQLRENLIEANVLYFLDAHWCVATNTAGELSQCPLLQELQAIGKLNDKSVILIDDARLFLAPPPRPHEVSHWPTFNQVIQQLLSMNNNHELMIVNDVIAYVPRSAMGAMTSYAQTYGIDWLTAVNCLREGETFLKQLAQKEATIQEKEATIQEKEAVLQVISKALLAYKLAYLGTWPFNYMARFLRKIIQILRPRLGHLYQYKARSVQIRTKQLKTNLTAYPRISVVTPSYQQGEYIKHTIQSVLTQDYPNLQYFIQDGGSTDNTLNVLKQYEDSLSGWTSEKDSGQSQAINLGFTYTDGEIMAWLNSDDLLLPGTLHVVADYFNRHPNVDVVYGNRLMIDENGMEIGRWILPGHDSHVLSWADYIPQETLFWRRRIWDKVGGKIDESFRFAMDWDLLVRFRDAGAKFGHIPQFLGAFRIHEHQKTSAVVIEIGHTEMNRIRERCLGQIPNHIEIKKAVLAYLLKHIAVDMTYRVKSRLRWSK